MDVELQATCSALGYLEGNQYVKEPDCLETVKDLIRFLRRDTDICDIRRQLGHAQIVQNDLIPLVKSYHADKVLFETNIKLLVNLTQPVITCFNNQIPDEKTLRNYCLEVESHLQDAKEAFADEELFGVLTEKVKDILKQDWTDRREEDRLQLERLFVLIRNVLMIPPDPAREQRTDDDATIHDQILWALHTSGMEDLILYIASSDRERTMLCMHIMEIISLMFREQSPETLASAGVQRSTTEKQRDQKQLEQAREKERAQKKANILKFSARHSRFGGTYVIQDMKSISDSNVIYHKPLCEVKSFSYDDGKSRKKISKNRAPIRTDNPTRRSTLSMRLSLKEFCVQFLVNAYNPLMRAVKDGLTRKTTQDNDETYYLWAMRFFMEFCRLCCKRVDLVSETMSMPAFHYIYTQLCTYYENVQLGKGEDAKVWGRRSHLALKAYQELLKTLDFMSRSRDKQIQESAKVIQSNVFYMIEYRDIFVTLLKRFKESKSSRAYLRDLVESTHIFLKMLEHFTKGNKRLVVQKKSKGRRKKKTRQNVSNGEPPAELSEEDLTVLWDTSVSDQLTAALDGRTELPQDVTPFDATLDMALDDQRIDTMLRVQSCLRDGNVAEATALFRAAREVWPEQEEFGSEAMGLEEELAALREIFMAALPRRQSQIPVEENVEDIEGQDVEEEEMEEVRTSEQEFDFKLFISDFAHQDVVKTYATLLCEFPENSDSVNHCLVKMMHRVSHDLGYTGMLFQASVFKTFSSLLHGPFAKMPRYKELSKFACFVVRQFTAIAQVNKKVFVDLMFWKTRNEALAITGDYDFNSKSKGKILWKEHEEQELQALFEKYKDAEDPELDTVELILSELTSTHTRMQVLRELKKQGLIASAKDIRKKKSGASKKWTDEEVQQLTDAVNLHREADHPMAGIMSSVEALGKSKQAVTRKILELGLVADRQELRKKKKGRGSGRGGRRSESEDGGRSGSESDEGERLFPERKKRSRRRSWGSDNGSTDEEDDDDDEDVQLLVRQAASTVGDYVKRLVENGYKDQIAWIQRGLRNTAEDREEGVCVPTPIVPLTEENETAMEDELFLIFLRSIGVTPPANEQEKFWRISAALSAADLLSIADGLTVGESGEATDADGVQSVVSRVFPDLFAAPSRPSTSSSSKSERKKTSKKSKRAKDGREKSKKEKKKTNVDKKRQKKQNDETDESDGHVSDENADVGNDDRASCPSASGSDGSSDDNSSSSDNDDNTPVKKEKFRPKLPTASKDSDTSDSGLDLDLEAREQERLWQERKNAKKGGEKKKSGENSEGRKKSGESRRAALQKMIEKKNKKRERSDRGKNRASKETLPNSGTTEVSAEDGQGAGVADGDVASVARLTGDRDDDSSVARSGQEERETSSKSPGNDKSNKRKRGRRIAMLGSDSDSDVETKSRTGSAALGVQEEEEEGAEVKVSSRSVSPPANGGTAGKVNKKRALESDSDSDDIGGTTNSTTEGKRGTETPKRVRVMQSDDDDNGDDGGNDNGDDEERGNVSRTEMDISSVVPSDENSDKENNNESILDQSGASQSQSQQDDSLRLHFDTSSDEEGEDKDGEDKEEKKEDADASKGENAGADQEEEPEPVDDESTPAKQAGESFPATLFTQGLDSDDEDNDHIPLRAVMSKKKKPMVIDDEDDDDNDDV
ncbi:protein timeless homolog [Aplysia californica]|uniref:Protein timeless homolog n=1 Tax=Aplysia californica TaxID=6500 RepID=A0ABM1A141_APLCA|nr:protein timeless homolog [Aplysia californica]